MRLAPHAWTNTLKKLGLKVKSKSRTKATRQPTMESLEARQMFWGTVQPVYPTLNDPTCPSCPCSPIAIGPNLSPITTSGPSNSPSLSGPTSPNPNASPSLASDQYTVYNAGLNPHYVIRFDTDTDLQGLVAQAFQNDGAYMSATLTFGSTTYLPVFYQLPSDTTVVDGLSTEVDAFAFEVDASELATGRYNWSVRFDIYNADGDCITDNSSPAYLFHPHTYLGVQDVINRKTSDVNSTSERPNPFGDGWSLPDLDRLYFQTASDVQPAGTLLVTGDNRCIWFPDGLAAPETNPFASPVLGSDPDSARSEEPTGNIALTYEDGTINVFNSVGLLLKRQDRHGNLLREYSYGGSAPADDDIESITDNVNGVEQIFSYDAGMVSAITSTFSPTDSTTIAYQYDSTGHMISVTEPDPDGPYGPLTSPFTQFGYDSTTGLLTSEIDPRGLETDVQYDWTRHVSAIIQRCGGTIEINSIPALLIVDTSSGVGTEANPAPLVKASDAVEHDVVYGDDIYITRNRDGNPTSYTDALGNTTTYTYAVGENGDVGNTNTGGLLKTITQLNPNYDPQSLPEGYEYFAVLTTTYTYDGPHGYESTYLTKIETPAGLQTWTYDDVATNYAGTVKLLQSSNDGVSTATYTYDLDYGDLKSIHIADPDGYTYFSYTSNGLIENITDARGNITHYEYDGYRVISVTQAYGTALAVITQYAYDDRGNITQVTDPLGNKTQYVYDNLNRLIETIGADPDGAGPKARPTWSYTYDQNGNLTSVTDPLSNTTQYTYDVRDRATQVIQPVADPSVSPQSVIKDEDASGVSYTGTYSSITTGGALNADAMVISGAGASAAFAFTAQADTEYQVLVRWVPGSTSTTYDSHARWQVKDSSGTVLASLPVDLNQATQGVWDGSLMWQSLGAYSTSDGVLNVVLDQGTGSGDLVVDAVKLVQVGPITQYKYDCASNLVSTTDPLGNKTTYVYDADNRLIQVIQPVADPVATPTRTEGPITQYAYNNLGWLSSQTDPNGNTTAYLYDTMGRITKQIELTNPGLAGTYGSPSQTRVDNSIDFAPSTSSFAQTTWTGAVYVPNSGKVIFTLNYIGSATFQVDGTTLVNNYSSSDFGEDIQYGNDLYLSAGWHTITLNYGSAAGYSDTNGNVSGLKLSYQIGEGSQEVVPASALSQCNVSLVTLYDGLARPQYATDPMGLVSQYNYNSLGQTTFAHQGDSSTNIAYDPVGNTIAQSDSSGNFTKYVYDNLNQLVQTIQPLANPTQFTQQTLTPNDISLGWTNNVASSNGATATFSFADLDDTQKYEVLIKWTNSSNPAAYDSNAIFRIYAGDDNSAPLLATWSVNLNAAPDASINLAVFPAERSLGAYFPQNSALTVEISDGNSEGVLTIDSVTIRTAGPVTSYTYDANGNRTSLTDPNGNTTQWRYDDLNRVVEQFDTLGHYQHYSYDAVGNLLWQIDGSGRITRYSYDNLYRQTSEIWQQETVAPEVVGRYVFYNYSLFDDFTEGANPADDGAIAPDKEVLLPGETADSAKFFDTGLGINGIMIDIAGLPHDGETYYLTTSDFTFKVGNTSDPSTWDALETENPPDISIRPGDGKDGSDRVTIIWEIGAIVFEWLQVTVEANENTGLSTPDVFYFGNLPGDADGNFSVDSTTDYSLWLTGLTDPDPQTITSTSDLDHNGTVDNTTDYSIWLWGLTSGVTLTTLTAPATTLREITYTYDANSRLTSVVDYSPVTNTTNSDYSYTYDNLGRVSSIVQTLAGLAPIITFAQSFDNNGNRTQLAATIGSTSDFVNDYTYGALNLLTQIKQHGVTGGNTVAEKRIDFTYNAVGQFTTINRYASLTDPMQLVATSAYSYDSSERLIGLTHEQNSGNVFAGYSWGYYNDRVTSFTNSVHTDENVSYTYDTNGQLTGANYASLDDEDYSYDANGNRTNDGYSTAANNRLDSDGTFNYTYDNNGNLISKVRISSDAADDHETDYEWDFRNRLASVTMKDNAGDVTQKVVYAYDAFDRLIGRQVFEGTSSTASVSQHFIYDGMQIVETLSDNGDVQNRYLWGPEVDQLLAQEDSSGNVLWALGDNLNTVRDYVSYNSTSDETTVVDHAQYDAFGNRLNTASVEAAFGWTGRYRDSVTGLQYNTERWLDTTTGRWLSQDPIGFRGDISNLYRYVGNSTTNWIDPSGLIARDWDEVHPPRPTPPGPASPGSGWWYYPGPGTPHWLPVPPGGQGVFQPVDQGNSPGWSYFFKHSPTAKGAAITAGVCIIGIAAAPEVTIMESGVIFRIISRTLRVGFRVDPGHHGKPPGHWHFWNWW